MIPTYKLSEFVRRKCLITVFSKLSLACITQPKKEILTLLWIMNKKQSLQNEASGTLCVPGPILIQSYDKRKEQSQPLCGWLFAKHLGFLRMNFTPRRKFNQQLCSFNVSLQRFVWLFGKFHFAFITVTNEPKQEVAIFTLTLHANRWLLNQACWYSTEFSLLWVWSAWEKWGLLGKVGSSLLVAMEETGTAVGSSHNPSSKCNLMEKNKLLVSKCLATNQKLPSW